MTHLSKSVPILELKRHLEGVAFVLVAVLGFGLVGADRWRDDLRRLAAQQQGRTEKRAAERR
jgi:hypothetical protein